MLKIGLTGGIGSGKTTIAKIFSTLGIPVYDADSAAKSLMRTHPEIKKKIIENFGDKAYDKDQLNRDYLANTVFISEEKLHILNAIVHPVTIQDSIEWFSNQTAPYAIKEAALIFESGSEKYLDYIIGVWSPQELRIARTMQRGGITKEEIVKRMKQQMDETEKMKRCDFVIQNDASIAVIPQVMELHKKFTSLGNR